MLELSSRQFISHPSFSPQPHVPSKKALSVTSLTHQFFRCHLIGNSQKLTDRQFLYAPSRPLVEEYCSAVKNSDRAEALLNEKGKKEGDYVLFRENGVVKLFCIDANDEIKCFSLKEEERDLGRLNFSHFPKLIQPLLPPCSSLNSSALHHSILGYRYFSLFSSIHNGDINRAFPSSELGMIQDVAEWVQEYRGQVRFHPSVFYKTLGHFFGLQGEHRYYFQGMGDVGIKEHRMEFNMMTSGLAKNLITSQIVDYLPKSKLSKSVKKKLTLMSKNSFHVSAHGPMGPSIPQAMKLLKQGVPIALFTGWGEHKINLVLNDKQLIFINKSDPAQPGMRVFDIMEPITEEHLSTLLSYSQESQFPAMGEFSDLEALLKLKLNRWIPGKLQKADICAIANGKSMFAAGQILLGVSDAQAKVEHKACWQEARLYWLDIFMMLMDKEESDPALKQEMYFSLLFLTFKLAKKKQILGRLSSADSQVVDRLKQKVLGLQVCGEDHPYLHVIQDLMENRIEPSMIEASHQEVLAQASILYTNHYKLAKELSGTST